MAHRHHHGPLTEGAAPAALASEPASTSSAAAPMPNMAMAFSSGHDVVLLFEWWHPTTPFAYALSLGVVFGLCLLQEWLLAKKLRRAVPHCKPCEDGGPRSSAATKGESSPLVAPRGTPAPTALRRLGDALLHTASVALGFALMLLVMSFNAGVFVYNLRQWAALNLTEEAEYWIEANTREKLYQLGSQPPLTLSVLGRHGRCQELPAAWHLDCLGCIGQGRIKTAAQLADAKLLHWNGPNKPFPTAKGKRAHAELFEPYAGKGAQCKPGGG